MTDIAVFSNKYRFKNQTTNTTNATMQTHKLGRKSS